jgi:hypothetical protein
MLVHFCDLIFLMWLVSCYLVNHVHVVMVNPPHKHSSGTHSSLRIKSELLNPFECTDMNHDMYFHSSSDKNVK